MTQEQCDDFLRLSGLYRLGHISAHAIAQACGLSVRHVRRLLTHLPVPSSRQPWNRLSDEIRSFIIEQKKERPSFNCQRLCELASDRFARPVSQSSVWRILHGEDLLGRTQHSPVLRQRFESGSCGELVQMDTTWGYWLGDRRLYLILLLDDHSRCILHARFFLKETLWHNMVMVREVVETYGIFKVLYTDNASWFKVIRHNKSSHQVHSQHEYESDITKACRELGIVHVTHKPYEPQGKGKIERLFRFIQERFVSELDDLQMELWLINKKFQDWVKWYNTLHKNRTTGQTPQKRFDPTGFKPLCVTERRTLDDIFCIRETRTVDKCNEFRYQGASYRLPTNRSLAHRKVDLHIHPSKKIRVWFQGQFIAELPIL